MKHFYIMALAMICMMGLHGQTDYTTSVNQPQSGKYEIHFDIEHWNLDTLACDGVVYQKIKFSSSTVTKEKGWAELPFVSASVQLPADRNVSMQVKYVQYRYDTLSYPLLPSRGVIYRNQDPKNIAYQTSPASLVDAFYPSEMVKMESPFIVRDVRGTTVRLFPFQYNAVTRVLRIATSVTIELVENNQPAVNPLLHDNHHPPKEAVGMYKSLFLNYQSRREDLATSEAGDILVITTQAYEAAIEPYIQWKKEMGYKVKKLVVATGTNVKNVIRDEYESNNDLMYVQLVGDWADIKSDASVDNSPTDPYMGCVAGDDYYPDIAIGRFSCNTAAQLSVQVNKTIEYEKSPDMTAGWRESFIGVASSEGPGDDDEIDYNHIRRIYTQRLENFTYNNHLHNYEPNESLETLKQQINQGASVIAYCGHGSKNGFATTGFGNTDIRQLTNVAKLPFIVSVACLNGAFHNSSDCFAEAWLKKENGGAVVALMSTISQPWTPPQRGQDYFFDILVGGFNYDDYSGQAGINTNEQRTHWGSIVVNSFNLMLNESNSTDDRETFQTWTTFGDASLQLRTKHPDVLTSSNMVLTVGEPYITTIQVNGEPLQDALVCISQNDVYLSAYTDENGVVSIPHDFTPGNVLVVVTAFNTTTIYETITCASDTSPYLIVDSYTPNQLAGGETSQLSLKIMNLGGIATTGTTHVTLSSEADVLTWLDDSEECAIIAAEGGVADCTNSFQVAVADNVQTGDVFPVQVSMSCGQDTWTDIIYLTVYGADCVTPVGFQIEINNEVATLKWDDHSTMETVSIIDDAETHTAFTINSPGSVGWSYVDGDMAQTGTFRALDFINEGSSMAYIIMNTQEATGIGEVAAHSGVQFWGSPYAVSDSWYSSISNDDWLISPQLQFADSFTVNFFARSFSSSYATEKFYVEYSTSGNAASDFIQLFNSPVTTTTAWTEYTYTLPAEAKYVAIHCVSNNQYMFCVDDITITGEAVNGYTYNVYRDDELIARNVLGGQYVDEIEPESEHCYTVTANCPQLFESIPTNHSCIGLSYIDGQNGVVTEGTESALVKIYPNPATHQMVVEGEQLVRIEMYNMSGQLVKTIPTCGNLLMVNVSDLADGLYFIKTITNNSHTIEKVIIQH